MKEALDQILSLIAFACLIIRGWIGLNRILLKVKNESPSNRTSKRDRPNTNRNSRNN